MRFNCENYTIFWENVYGRKCLRWTNFYGRTKTSRCFLHCRLSSRLPPSHSKCPQIWLQPFAIGSRITVVHTMGVRMSVRCSWTNAIFSFRYFSQRRKAWIFWRSFYPPIRVLRTKISFWRYIFDIVVVFEFQTYLFVLAAFPPSVYFFNCWPTCQNCGDRQKHKTDFTRRNSNGMFATGGNHKHVTKSSWMLPWITDIQYCCCAHQGQPPKDHREKWKTIKKGVCKKARGRR